MTKPSLWMLLIIVLEIGFVAALAPGDWPAIAMKSEAQMIDHSLGREQRDFVLKTATHWYDATLVKTGVWQSLFDMLIPSKEHQEKDVVKAPWLFRVLSERLVSLQHTVYLIFMRLALLVSWLPYVPLLLIPALWDGVMTWKIKRTNFDYSSPILHRYGLRTAGIVIFIMAVLFMLPIAVTPVYIPAALMLIIISIGFSTGNIQKRI